MLRVASRAARSIGLVTGIMTALPLVLCFRSGAGTIGNHDGGGLGRKGKRQAIARCLFAVYRCERDERASTASLSLKTIVTLARDHC